VGFLLVIVAVVVVLVADAVLWRRRRKPRAASAMTTSPDPLASPTVSSEPTDATASAGEADGVEDVAGLAAGSEAPGPPAAIHMAITGTHPWAPAHVFIAELKAKGYDTTVELPDLVVMRDVGRLPITVREPAGPPGRLVITATPDQIPVALEILVRSLLDSGFTLQEADGRDVRLIDDQGADVRVTVTQLSTV
jgi:hypothetical protein